MDARSDIQLDKQHVERIEGAHALPEYVEHLARYRFALQWAPAARVLDVCCGVGYGSFLIAAAGAAHVTGLDLSEEAIAAARRQPSLPNLSFQVADACQPYPEPGTWDLITCFEGIEHVAKPQVLLSWVYDALRPGGVAVISTPNADGYEGGSSGNPFHLAEMSERQFREIVTSFGWNTEWYAQISKQAVWTRPLAAGRHPQTP